ncbi:MAG: (2Fe-2S) ferredoxin domain-containing protein [Ichthyobacteriaceae bacterium]|nr:(2Fe-2S) ferredoxin domain-containing protein [Ichthyobacteriaceae bacterium]
MSKIKSLSDLRKMREDMLSSLELRENADSDQAMVQVKIGMATSGIAAGAREIFNFFASALPKRNIKAIVTQTGDMGIKYAEPLVMITVPGKEAVVFGKVDIDKADEIIETYIKKGELVDGVVPQSYKTI